MLTIGDAFPAHSLKAVPGGAIDKVGLTFIEVTQDSAPDRWTIWVFIPKAFTFVCPTELTGFGDLAEAFARRNAVVYASSTDNEFVWHAWRTHHDGLRSLPYAVVADTKRELASALGILDKNEGVDMRATFIVDPAGVIRHVSVNDLSVGRNPQEILRILDALQTDGLCPCNWTKGDAVLERVAPP